MTAALLFFLTVEDDTRIALGLPLERIVPSGIWARNPAETRTRADVEASCIVRPWWE